MSDDKIKVWLAVDRDGSVKTRTVRREVYMTQAAASQEHGYGASWETMESFQGWTVQPYTLLKGWDDKNG